MFPPRLHQERGRGEKRTLRLTVSDSEVAGARVGRVGASIVLDGAAPLEGTTDVDERVAVDGKGPGATSGAGDGRGSTAQGAGEGLDVGAARVLALGSAVGGSSHGRVDLVGGGLLLEEVLADDAADGVVFVVTAVAFASAVVFLSKKSQSRPCSFCCCCCCCSDDGSFTYIAGSKGTGLNGQGRIGADGGELLRNVQGDLLVARGGIRGRILVLGDGSDLRVGGGLVADDRGLADGGSVSLQGAEHDGVGHSRDIVGRLGVGEGLVGDDLLEAVEVVDVGGSLGGSGVAEEREDGILDLQRVVELQVRVCDVEDGLVGVLLRDLSLHDTGVEGDLAGSSQPDEGEEGGRVLHLCGLDAAAKRRRRDGVELQERKDRPVILRCVKKSVELSKFTELLKSEVSERECG